VYTTAGFSVLPEMSVARTENVCRPSARPM
jgi:hypothetical protein